MVGPLHLWYEVHPQVNRGFHGTLLHIDCYLCIHIFLPQSPLYLNKTWSPKLDRQRGFSNHTAAAMFRMTIINFLLSSLYTGIQVVGFIVFIQKALILDINYLLPEKWESINNALLDMNIVDSWAQYLPVSIKLLLSDLVSIHTWWRYCSVISLSFGGLGPSFQIDSR